jgi:DNA-directed RNA polymerase subunit RPC12/RpoP
MGQKPFGSPEASADEPWATGVAKSQCKNCGQLVFFKAVPLWGEWYHLICPYCSSTAWARHKKEEVKT